MHDAKRELVALSDYAFQRTWRRLEGLGDDEYLWEPVAPAWSVRPRADGTFRADYAVWPESPPFTTFAWRLWHLTVCYGQTRNATFLGVSAETCWTSSSITAPKSVCSEISTPHGCRLSTPGSQRPGRLHEYPAQRRWSGLRDR